MVDTRPAAQAGYQFASPHQIVAGGYRPTMPSPGEIVDWNSATPERFQTHAPIQTDIGRTFGRSALASTLDAAALPVTLAGQAAEALGYPNRAAHLSGRDAAEAVEYLGTGREPADIRREENFAAGEIPEAQKGGALVGDALGGAPLGALTGRVPGLGPVIGLGKGAGSKSPKAKQAADFIKSHPEAPVVKDYMRSGYDQVNGALRAEAGVQAPGTSRAYHEQGLVKAEKLKTVLEEAAANGHAQPGTVLRGMELPAGTVENWKKAGAIENRSFWSTTADANTAESFRGMQNSREFPEKVLLRIKQKDAVPVGALNGGFEDELILPPGRKWEITGSKVDDYGHHVLDLRQVKEFKPGTVPALSFDGQRTGPASAIGVRAPLAEEDHRE